MIATSHTTLHLFRRQKASTTMIPQLWKSWTSFLTGDNNLPTTTSTSAPLTTLASRKSLSSTSISHGEIALIQQSQGRIVTYLDTQLKQAAYAGQSWLQQCQDIVRHLPEYVYISCDVDGLDPKLCSHTGTPVPGGLNLEEIYCLWREVVRSGRQIIGCDICETGNHEWDGNVSARILYKLFSLMTLVPS